MAPDSASTMRPLQRPWWLPAEDWRNLLALHGHAPRCAVCGETRNLSVDHIQPRKYRGPDDLSNLQFLCVPHNSQKGITEDGYWGRAFYWDQVPSLERMRTAQRRAPMSLSPEPPSPARPHKRRTRRTWVCPRCGGLCLPGDWQYNVGKGWTCSPCARHLLTSLTGKEQDTP